LAPLSEKIENHWFRLIRERTKDAGAFAVLGLAEEKSQ